MKYTRRNVLISVVVIQTHDITDPLSRSILCGKASKHVCLMHLGKPCLPTQKSSSGWSIATSVCLKVIKCLILRLAGNKTLELKPWRSLGQLLIQSDNNIT